MKQDQDIFIPGSEWIYYKFYTGIRTADYLLVNMIKPIADRFIQDHLIDKWFFIRYADPEFHLRVRFHLQDTGSFAPILGLVTKSALLYIKTAQIHKIQLDTYLRETARYGEVTMDLSEQFFYRDSEMVIAYLNLNNEGPYRWLFGLQAIDALLTDFNYTLSEKLEILRSLNEKSSNEFNKDRQLAQQISKKYRTAYLDIEYVLSGKNAKFNDILGKRSGYLSLIIDTINEIDNLDHLEVPIHILLEGYIHMMMNRIFLSRQRIHEMVIYDILFRYYKSMLAKNKYGRSS